MSVASLSVFADEIWVESTKKNKKRREANASHYSSITSVDRLMTVPVAVPPLPLLLLLVVVGVKYTSSQTIWQAF